MTWLIQQVRTSLSASTAMPFYNLAGNFEQARVWWSARSTPALSSFGKLLLESAWHSCDIVQDQVTNVCIWSRDIHYCLGQTSMAQNQRELDEGTYSQCGVSQIPSKEDKPKTPVTRPRNVTTSFDLLCISDFHLQMIPSFPCIISPPSFTFALIFHQSPIFLNWLFFLCCSLSLSLSLSLCLCFYVSVSLSLSLYIYMYICCEVIVWAKFGNFCFFVVPSDSSDIQLSFCV